MKGSPARIPGRVLSPNEMYAVLVSAAGYVPVMLTGEDYIELLPGRWRTINDYGLRIDGRTYDAKALNPYRRQHSGIAAQRGRWEVHYDPYDLAQVWVRNHHHGGWLRAPWTHAAMVTAPFADFTWRHAQQNAAITADKPDEAATARSLAQLLNQAGQGPGRAQPSQTDQRIIARTQAGAAAHRPPIDHAKAESEELWEGDDDPDEEEEATVIPFGVFDARAEAQRWP